jgi:hypothetical protein
MAEIKDKSSGEHINQEQYLIMALNYTPFIA